MHQKPAITATAIHELLSQRWSPRAFDAHQTVSKTQLLALMEAARWAPSCYGAEPWRYIICDKSTHPEAYDKAFSCLVEFNQAWVKNASVILFALSYDVFAYNQAPNRWSSYDTGAASENICLQAAGMGLIAHQMGGFDAEKVLALFEVPENFSCMAAIAIGYQASPDILSEDMKKSELAERTRKPIESFCFDGAWEKGFGG